MAGNSQRKGSIKKTGKGNPTAGLRRPRAGVGSRARARRPRRRTARTTRPTSRRSAADRDNTGPRTKRRTSSDAEWAAGRNSVLELLRGGVPVTAIYVAEGAERDNRLREAFKLAAEQGVQLLEVTRNEMDRMTSGAVHQGLAARLPAYEYAHADDLLDRAAEAKEPAAHRRARPGHRPAQPRRGDPLGGGLRRARRPHPGAACCRHDCVRVEDQRRCGCPAPGRADGQPDPPAQGLPGGGLHGRRPGRRRRPLAARAGRSRRSRRRARSWWSSGPRARAWAASSRRPATRSSRSRCPDSWSRSTPVWPPRSPSTRSRRPARHEPAPTPRRRAAAPCSECGARPRGRGVAVPHQQPHRRCSSATTPSYDPR